MARSLLEAGKASEAVASLEDSLRRIPESGHLKAQLNSAKKRVAAEEAERQRSEQEKRRNREEIAGVLAAAKQSLDSNQTARAVANLEQALRSHPESEELKGQLAVARKRFTAEQAERERVEQEARRRQVEVDREISCRKTTSGLKSGGKSSDCPRGRYQELS